MSDVRGVGAVPDAPTPQPLTGEFPAVDEVRFFTRDEDTVNGLLDGEWVLLAAGVNPYGDATYVLGHRGER